MDLPEYNISELEDQMAAGHLSAHDLAASYLRRIKQLDQNGPALGSMLELNPDALADAAALDVERGISGPRGPLHGIPIVLKGNIDTADRMQTTAGSAALAGHIAAQDAFLVSRLRDAGVVILGKSNLSEWANFRSSRSTSGWSSLGGQTRNPYALDRNPCGSSSGSAVAVAANLCSTAVGTETDGSIVCPAHTNGIVGIKPTVGLVSRSGIIPISSSQDTAGPMARTVEDAAILLGAMSGIDPRDEATLDAEGKIFTDYTQFLDPSGLRDARIGVARNLFGFSPRVDQIMQACIDTLKRQGADVVDPVHLAGKDEIKQVEKEVLLYEFKDGLNKYLATVAPHLAVHTLAELIAFNQSKREQIMPFFGQGVLHKSEAKGPLSDIAYREARDACLRLARNQSIDATMKEHKLHAILAPTGAPAWPTDLVNGDPSIASCSRYAAVAGYPHITVPAGSVFGLPVGVSFFASAYQEPMLIKLAYAFEQATHARRPPTFLPTVDLDLTNQ